MTKKSSMTLETIAIDDLQAHPRNYRGHPAEQIAHLKASLAEYGIVKNIVVASDNVILAGHGLVQAAREAGYKELPVCRIAMPSTDPKAQKFMVLDNEVSRKSEDDTDQLAALLKELQDSQDLTGTGYDSDEVTQLLNDLQAEEFGATLNEDAGPEEPPIEPVTRLGDIWVMGEHRLVCGDCTEVGVWDALNIVKEGSVCFTSPPYSLGASVTLRCNKNMSARGSAYIEKETDDWRGLMDGMTTCAYIYSEVSVINIQPLAGNKRELIKWLADNSDRLCDIVTWDKGHAAPQIAEGVLASRYEWLVILSDNNANRSVPLSGWRGTLQSVYEAPPQRNNEYADIHGATFPVHLPEYVLSQLCDKSKSVIDCFMGTGTTLIAAEQTGRICYGIELEPRYVDVAVKRWQKLTGKQAILESTGEAFSGE